MLGAVLPTGGHVEILAVREAWRNRGLGTALLLHSFRQLARLGHERITLGVDATNVTGANRVYERAGMRVCHQTDFFEKELPATR